MLQFRFEEKFGDTLSATLTLVTPTLIMNTQHTGDGPPGDDDYYNLVEEETNRATEKMELHRIVHRLLAL